MIESTSQKRALSPLNGKPVLLAFDGAKMSSDAGLTLLQEVERRTDLAGLLSLCLTDLRDPGNIPRTPQSIHPAKPPSPS